MPEDRDDLPPFTSLTKDEEWQRKAEYHPPGTYYVVANSESFQDFEEYRSTRSNVAPITLDRAAKRSSQSNVSVDGATLILGVFEDVPRKSPGNPAAVLMKEQDSTNGLSMHTDNKSDQQKAMRRAAIEACRPSVMLIPTVDFSESKLQLHYRSFVRPHVFRINKEIALASKDTDDFFETEAARCPPVCVSKSTNCLS